MVFCANCVKEVLLHKFSVDYRPTVHFEPFADKFIADQQLRVFVYSAFAAGPGFYIAPLHDLVNRHQPPTVVLLAALAYLILAA